MVLAQHSVPMGMNCEQGVRVCGGGGADGVFYVRVCPCTLKRVQLIKNGLVPVHQPLRLV